MTRAHFVKKARKDNRAVKAGQPYWWWKFMVGGRGGPKHYSATQPTRSQLTQSDFLSQIYALEDGISMAGEDNPEDFAGTLESLAGEVESLGSEQQDKYDNMPEGLQQGDSGQLLEARVEACERIAQELNEAAESIRGLEPPEKGTEEEAVQDGDDADEWDWQTEAQEFVDGVDWSTD